MHDLLKKIYTKSRSELCEDIYRHYQQHKAAVVQYLYFANISGKKILQAKCSAIPVHQKWSQQESSDMADKKNYLFADRKKCTQQELCNWYTKALYSGDFLLPDGIALQIYYWVVSGRKKRLPNHNGTDFLLYFLSWLAEKQEKQNIEIVMYGSYPDLLAKARQYLEKQGYTVVYAQDGYRQFDWMSCEQACVPLSEHKIRVLLLGMTTPTIPLQELRAQANHYAIQKGHFLVFGQGGTFDFWAGKQKRAPKLVRTIKLERLRRLITDPKRNVKKVIDSLSLLRYIFSYFLLKR